MARETWSRKTEFILSSIGYAVGLGNVWRFPYLCYANGGGAFLIPYFTLLAVAVLPVMVLDACIGQFTSLGCVTCWKFSPLFKGVGIAMVMISAYCSLYYPIIISYTIRYMVASFNNPLPWVGCNHTWNTVNCYERPSHLMKNIDFKNLSSSNESVGTTVISETFTSMLSYDPSTGWTENDTTLNGTQSPVVRIRASEEFWKHGVLGISDGIHEVGPLKWQLLLCMVAAWVVIYVCVMKGIKSTGKVSCLLTATFPYLVLFILLIRGLTLPGSWDGIVLYMKPQWEKLQTSQVWKSAANQVFYSYGAGWGGILTLASYNKFHNNSVRDALMICVCCAFSSIFAGFVIFSVIGFMAYDSQLPVEDVVAAGPGLAFVVYPEALARLPVPQLWSFLFFFMLLTVGLDTQFVMLETLLSAIVDELAPHYPDVRSHRWKLILGTSILLFFLGLPLACEGGVYIMTFLDWYSAGFSPMLIVFIEVLVVSYIYD
ncbi:sodium- and chloride-dependent glycine transporter 2-like [Amphiura filiformis]|uniref:sodium- and chloride-dependent glycine transporter 2-like n=1 Tax=Amphiura filiformis TaxID=82378 RepID=UPI003B20DFBD